MASIPAPNGSNIALYATVARSSGRKAGTMTHAFIIPTQELGTAIVWMEAAYSSGQACTIDLQSRVIAIECRSPMAANQIATRVSDRPGWRREQDLWLFLEVLEPCVDFNAECEFAYEIVGDCDFSDKCEVAECWVVEGGVASIGAEDEFREAACVGKFRSDAADCEQI